MKQQRRGARKKLDYPETTAGSRLAVKARKLASKLSPEQRREHFNGAMAMIYGGRKSNLRLSSILASNLIGFGSVISINDTNQGQERLFRVRGSESTQIRV